MNIRLSLAGTATLIKGHPWIAPNAQLSYRVPPPAGTVLRVQDMNGDFLGWCVSEGPQAMPAFRMLSRERHADLGSSGWEAAVERALGKRRPSAGSGQGLVTRSPRRLVNGEVDGLPGMVCDAADGVGLLSVRSLGMQAFTEQVGAALLQQARLRGLWQRFILPDTKGWGPWHRSPLAPASPAKLNLEEDGRHAAVDLELAGNGEGLPWGVERRAWRKWAQEQGRGRRILVLGDLGPEAEAAQAGEPAECLVVAKNLFKGLEKAAKLRPERVLLDIPASAKESFGKFDAAKNGPRLLADLAALCAPGAELLLCSAHPLLRKAMAWEKAWAGVLDPPPPLTQVLGPEQDAPENPMFPEGRGERAFVFTLPA